MSLENRDGIHVLNKRKLRFLSSSGVINHFQCFTFEKKDVDDTVDVLQYLNLCHKVRISFQ